MNIVTHVIIGVLAVSFISFFKELVKTIYCCNLACPLTLTSKDVKYFPSLSLKERFMKVCVAMILKHWCSEVISFSSRGKDFFSFSIPLWYTSSPSWNAASFSIIAMAITAFSRHGTAPLAMVSTYVFTRWPRTVGKQRSQTQVRFWNSAFQHNSLKKQIFDDCFGLNYFCYYWLPFVCPKNYRQLSE